MLGGAVSRWRSLGLWEPYTWSDGTISEIDILLLRLPLSSSLNGALRIKQGAFGRKMPSSWSYPRATRKRRIVLYALGQFVSHRAITGVANPIFQTGSRWRAGLRFVRSTAVVGA